VNDRCQGGKCIGYQVSCPIDGMNDCTGGCDEATGQCSLTVLKRDGARCQVVLATLEGMQTSRLWTGAKASCSTSDYQCRSGECVAVQKHRTSGAECTAGESAGTCDGKGSCITTAGNNPPPPVTPGGGGQIARSPRPRRRNQNLGGLPPLSSLVARPSLRPEDGAANAGNTQNRPRGSEGAPGDSSGSGSSGSWPVVRPSGGGSSSSGGSSGTQNRPRRSDGAPGDSDGNGSSSSWPVVHSSGDSSSSGGSSGSSGGSGSSSGRRSRRRQRNGALDALMVNNG
jgi:hypothetical protein